MTMRLSTSATSDCILRSERLTKRYADGGVNALLEVSVAIGRGEFVAIMGPSGSGKSTLLNLLGALDDPSSGVLYFEGRPYASFPSLDKLRSEKIGYVFQSFHLLPTLTALENVQVPMFESRRSARERVAAATELLQSVGMKHRLRHLPSQLSVGERQRVSIARALANNPPVLLADEPTGNLDSQTGAGILELFHALHRERQMTVIMVTHDRAVADHAERLICLRDGGVVSDERLHDLEAVTCQES